MEFDLETEEKTVAPPAKEDKPETITIPKAELDSIKRESQERDEAAKYWAGLARGSRPAETVEPVNDDPDPGEFIVDEAAAGLEGDTPEKMVDELAAKGVGALKSRGFITAADAQKLAAEVAIKVARQMIGQQVTRSTSDAQIMTAFPELKDSNSDLFRATAKIYQEAVAMDPNAKKTPAALFLAARAAKASLKPAPRVTDDEDDGTERESDRRRRADSQDSRPRGRGTADDTDDMLGEEARSVIKAMGITEEEFKAAKKSSGGAPRRR